MRRLSAAIACGLLSWSLAAAADVQVVDGGTLRLDGHLIRLWGIGAPERQQPCYLEGHWWRPGPEAAKALRDIIGKATPACAKRGRDGDGRAVASCKVRGRDIGEAMVRAGWAFDDDRYSQGAYTAAETEAKAAHRGVWRGTCAAPWEWRRALHRPDGAVRN